MISRRGLITGLISFVAAPAIVRASSLMPVKKFEFDARENLIELMNALHKDLTDAYLKAHRAMCKELYASGCSTIKIYWPDVQKLEIVDIMLVPL